MILHNKNKKNKYTKNINYKHKLPQNKNALKKILSKNKQYFINTLLPIISLKNQKIRS